MISPLFKTCRQCGSRSEAEWCGQECFDIERKELADWELRKRIFKRDKGVCIECELDTEALRKKLEKLIADVTPTRTATGYKKGSRFFEAVQELEALRVQYDWAIRKWSKSPWNWRIAPHLWEADHRQARSRGGNNRKSNLQTLCLGCHRPKTKYDMKLKKEES